MWENGLREGNLFFLDTMLTKIVRQDITCKLTIDVCKLPIAKLRNIIIISNLHELINISKHFTSSFNSSKQIIYTHLETSNTKQWRLAYI